MQLLSQKAPLILMLTIALQCFSSAGNADNLPANRPFYMGFTPWQFSWIEEKIAVTYQNIQDHGDIVAHHFDKGVPWVEALNQQAYHPNVEQALTYRTTHTDRNREKVYVAVTPLNFKRDGLAGDWGEKDSMDLPDDWENKTLADAEVQVAYINFCRNMIQRFKPDYFAYGIEVNMLAKKNPTMYAQLPAFSQKIYSALKAEFPNVSLFLTFSVDPPSHLNTFTANVAPLLPYSDLLALSTYPYGLEKEGIKSINELPRDWFSQLQPLLNGKKIAIAETGYIAEDMSIFGTDIHGSKEDQLTYVKFLLSEMEKMNAEFVIWYVPIDYDELWSVLKWVVFFNPVFEVWKDTGLWDGEVHPRPSLHYWDSWRALPIKK